MPTPSRPDPIRTPSQPDPGCSRPATPSPAEADKSVADLAHDLRAACMLVTRRVRYEADNALAPHLVSILARLSREPRTVGELAAIEQVSAPSMSRSVAHLHELGYVDRSADERDGRLVRLSLTAEGADLIHAERLRRDRWMISRMEDLAPEQRQVLREATVLLETVLDR